MKIRKIGRASVGPVSAVVLLFSAGVAAASGVTGPAPALVSGPSPFVDERCLEERQAAEQVGARVNRDWEQEPTIAVNPKDRRHMLVAWKQDGNIAIMAAVTKDGGETWTTNEVPYLSACTAGPFLTGATEPRAVIAPNGTAYIASFSRHELAPWATGARVQVSRSGDGGFTWPDPPSRPDLGGTEVASDFDGIAVEPDTGALVVVWSPLEAPDATFISRSVDEGKSWEPRFVRLAPPGTSAWNRLVATPTGRLVLLFHDAPHSEFVNNTEPQPVKMFAVSSDNRGVIWSLPVEVGRGVAFQWPSAALAPDGVLHAAWVDSVDSSTGATCRRFGPPAAKLGGECRIVATTSQDGGHSWRPGPSVEVLRWKGPWMPMPGMAAAADGTVGILATTPTSGDSGLEASVSLHHSHDQGRSWEKAHLAGPFSLDRLPEEADDLGLYHELAPLPCGFAAAFVQANDAGDGNPTDVFTAQARFAPRAVCNPPNG